MKNRAWKLLLAALCAAACSPQVYPLYMDVRKPSVSGVDLMGKNIGIVYLDGRNQVDSLFDRQVASSFARTLEEDYFGGSEQVGIFRTPGADSLTLSGAHSLVMETGSDVLFVLSSRLGLPSPGTNQAAQGKASWDSAYVCPVALPVQTTLWVYDSMGEDKIRTYNGSTVVRAQVYNDGTATPDALSGKVYGSLAPQSEDIGERISRRFLSQWQTESFSFYYYDSPEWIDALEKAAGGQFAGAIDIWGRLIQRGNAQRRACACFNIAQAFFLMGDYTFSESWLDEAEKLENVALGDSLRKRLKVRLEKL